MNLKKLLLSTVLFFSVTTTILASDEFEEERNLVNGSNSSLLASSQSSDVEQRNPSKAPNSTVASTTHAEFYNKPENFSDMWSHIASYLDLLSLSMFAQVHSCFNSIFESYGWQERLRRLKTPQTIVDLLPLELTSREKFKRLFLGVQLNLETNPAKIDRFVEGYKVTSLYPELWESTSPHISMTYINPSNLKIEHNGLETSELARKGLHWAIKRLFWPPDFWHLSKDEDYEFKPSQFQGDEDLVDILIKRNDEGSLLCQSRINLYENWKKNRSLYEAERRKEIIYNEYGLILYSLDKVSKEEGGVAAAQKYCDEQIEKGNHDVLALKLDSLFGYLDDGPLETFKFYPQAPEAVNQLLEEGCRFNKKAFLLNKLIAILEGLYEYEKNLEKAHEFIEDLVKKQQPVGYIYKLSGLRRGEYGYEKDEDAARNFILENGLPF